MVDGLDPVEVGLALQASVGVFTRHLRQLPVGDELSFGELLVLSRLNQLGPSTAAALARAEQVTPQSIGVTVAELERRGLVERRGDPKDKRRVLVTPTASGETALRERRDTRTDQIATALAQRFTPAELDTLSRAAALIERLGRALQ